jgi:hypothetical protein
MEGFRLDQGKAFSSLIARNRGGHEGPLWLSPTWCFTRQPCSPKRLGHFAAFGGREIASACTRLDGSDASL